MRGLVSDLSILQIEQRPKELQVRGVLAKGAAQPGLPQFMAVVAVPPTNVATLPGRRTMPGHQPAHGASDLEIVQPDIALANALRIVGKKRKRRHAAGPQSDTARVTSWWSSPVAAIASTLPDIDAIIWASSPGARALDEADRPSQSMAHVGPELVLEFCREGPVEGVPALFAGDPKFSSGRSASIRLWIALTPW